VVNKLLIFVPVSCLASTAGLTISSTVSCVCGLFLCASCFKHRTENSHGPSYQTNEQATKDNQLLYPQTCYVISLTELLAECFISANKMVHFIVALMAYHTVTSCLVMAHHVLNWDYLLTGVCYFE
jgi:hypothetical protein